MNKKLESMRTRGERASKLCFCPECNRPMISENCNFYVCIPCDALWHRESSGTEYTLAGGEKIVPRECWFRRSPLPRFVDSKGKVIA